MNCGFCGNPLYEAQYLVVGDIVYKSCPKCSRDNGEQHIYYDCPKTFGITSGRENRKNPMGLQSYCAKCRSGSSRQGPHENAFPCSQARENEGYVINGIRLLPMSQPVFDSYDEVKNFIVKELPGRGGLYYYMNGKMNGPSNTLVLFQYGEELVGYAVHLDTVELDEPLTYGDGSAYKGYYQFAPGTITLLNKPITKEEFASVDPAFNAFSQSIQEIEVGLLPAIFKTIKEKGEHAKSFVENRLPEEVDEEETGPLFEGAKKKITVNAIERNPQARIACINHYRKKNKGRLKCEICGFDFGKRYGDEFADKMHIHHLIEISSVGNEYEVNPIEDLIPICPNCHLVVHNKRPAYTPGEIREMLRGETVDDSKSNK
ncbi:MAG: hypothetical protein GX561_10855 [Lentisphaerae bacterium]|nr:hypothetical protein [Lentisphaerota bacterium]